MTPEERALDIIERDLERNRVWWDGHKAGAIDVLRYQKQHPEISLDELLKLAEAGAPFTYGQA